MVGKVPGCVEGWGRRETTSIEDLVVRRSRLAAGVALLHDDVDVAGRGTTVGYGVHGQSARSGPLAPPSTSALLVEEAVRIGDGDGEAVRGHVRRRGDIRSGVMFDSR